MTDIDPFIELVKKSLKCDPWVEQRGIKGYAKEIIDEAQEALVEAKAGDWDKLKEEMGDVLHDWLHLVLLAEKEGHFTMDDIIHNSLEKFNRRKPYLKEGRKVTLEEARKIWKEAKMLERHQ